MSTSKRGGLDVSQNRMRAGLAAALLILAALPNAAPAIAVFNRQTGQNCVVCRAGGQFPELTPYGRLFKLAGYTIGERAIPISAMAVATVSKVANTSKSDDPGADFQKDGSLIFATASLLLGGKATDNGSEGRGNETFPRIAGQHADYLVKQLVVFQRTDERPEGSIMKTVAHELARQNINDVAGYLQSLSGR